MHHLDNSGSKKEPVTFNFGIDVDGTRISYTYIRKNACSAFKEMFAFLSHHDLSQYDSILKGMIAHHHDDSIEAISSADFRVCVLRDPVDRAVSVFKNKFIQMAGNKDIFLSVERALGVRGSEVTFRAFVSEYVGRLKMDRCSVDPHLWRQSDHLYPVLYNAAIQMSELKSSMERIAGLEVSRKCFSKRLNSSVGRGDGSGLYGNCADRTAGELNELYKDEGFVPSAKDLLDESTAAALRTIYQEDLELFDRLD